jgi:hypothetical protein
VTILQIAREIMELVPGTKSTITFQPMPPDDPRVRCPDITARQAGARVDADGRAQGRAGADDRVLPPAAREALSAYDRRRWFHLLLLPLVIALGLASRRWPIGVPLYDDALGDCVVRGDGVLCPRHRAARRRPLHLAIAACVICLAIELFKLTGYPHAWRRFRDLAPSVRNELRRAQPRALRGGSRRRRVARRAVRPPG